MKLKSYLLLSVLTVVLFFILGVRYGQRVEKTNKILNYIKTISPTPNLTPTKPIEFIFHQNKECKIEFLYPTMFEIKQSSTSALFSQNNKTVIEYSCDKTNKIQKLFEDPRIATTEILFKNKKIVAKTIDDASLYVLKILQSKTGQYVYLSVSKNLLPLIDSTLGIQ